MDVILPTISPPSSPVLLNKCGVIALQCFQLRLHGLWKKKYVFKYFQWRKQTADMSPSLPCMRTLAFQTLCVEPRHHSQLAWCWYDAGQHASPHGHDWRGEEGREEEEEEEEVVTTSIMWPATHPTYASLSLSTTGSSFSSCPASSDVCSCWRYFRSL